MLEFMILTISKDTRKPIEDRLQHEYSSLFEEPLNI